MFKCIVCMGAGAQGRVFHGFRKRPPSNSVHSITFHQLLIHAHGYNFCNQNLPLIIILKTYLTKSPFYPELEYFSIDHRRGVRYLETTRYSKVSRIRIFLQCQS